MSPSEQGVAAIGRPPASLLLRLTRSRPDELRATLWAFVYFFALLAAFALRRRAS